VVILFICLYVYNREIVCLYVDDMIYTGNLELTHAMQSEFEMTDLGIMKYFLGIEVDQSTKGIFVYQKKYAADIIKKFRMEECNPTKTPIPLGTKLSKKYEGPTVDSIVSISSAEAEYVAATSASCQAVWLRRILNDMSHTENEPTPIFCDNTSTIALIQKPCVSQEKKSILTLAFTSYAS
jgi:hypothetical protein